MGVKIREKIKGSGKWWIYIDHQGRRKAKFVGSKKAAEKVKEIIEAKIKLGQPIEEKKRKSPPIPTLASYFDSFKKMLKGSVRESTQISYQYCFDRHLKPKFGSLRLDRITRENVEEFAAELVSRGLSKDSIRLILATLRRILGRAKRHRLLTENVAESLGEFYKQAPVRHAEIQPLTADEVEKFLAVVYEKAPQHFSIFLCAIHTGLRSGELAGLQWGDLDINGKFLMVRRNIVNGRVNPTKTGKIRKVDVSDALTEALLELRRLRIEKLLVDGKNELPMDSWIFANEAGRFPDMENLKKRYFHKCLQKAGIRRIRFHDLRHTFASLLLQNRESLAYVKDQLGHSSIKITVDVYGHLVPGSNREAVNRLPHLTLCRK